MILAIIISETTSNTASAAVVVPIIIPVAMAAGINPFVPALAATFAASFGFMLPVSTPQNAIVYGSGVVPITKMIRSGFSFDVLGALLIVLLLPVMVDLVLGCRRLIGVTRPGGSAGTGDGAGQRVGPWTTASRDGGGVRTGRSRAACAANLPVPIPRSFPRLICRLPRGAGRRTRRDLGPVSLAVPHLRESVMTDRRLAPLTALSTLARRPARRRCAPRLPSRSRRSAVPGRSRLVDNAVYSAGRRVATPTTAAESREELAAGEDRLAWLGLYRPGAAGAR